MNLLICESPNKKHTLSQILGKDWVVEASVGHITKIKDTGLYNLGIDLTNFTADFQVDEGKKDVVKKLKDLVKKADFVYLASDPDREGEAIAWHLKEQLNIPAKKLKRCVFHEVTKKAVEDAIKHPCSIDQNLVDAAMARAKLDKIIGYRLSPIARSKVYARSVGRCQSVGLKLVVDRENEIVNFDSKTYYEIWLPFIKNQKLYKAQYKGLKGKKNSPTLSDKNKAESIIKECENNQYIVNSIESKDRKVETKPPFITSSFQQEASSKLGYSVKKSTSLAQQLFEGIEIGGMHVGLISYIRTDSAVLPDEIVESVKKIIERDYGKDMFVGPKKGKKVANAQEGHAGIYAIDLTMTPEKLSHYIFDKQMLNVYKLIYNRTLECCCKPCIMTDTSYEIFNGQHKFVYTEHAIKDPGWKAISNDIEEDVQSESVDLKRDEVLSSNKLELLEKATQPPKRYSEATLIKELQERSIGRPSTFSTIISTLLDKSRGYCEEQGKALVPTEKGMQLSKFLDESFPTIINYDYTSNMEASLDSIAKGDLNEIDYLRSFYSDLESAIKHSRQVVINVPKKDLEYVEDHVCPNCGKKLVYRNGKFGRFISCSGWRPYNKGCNYTEKIGATSA